MIQGGGDAGGEKDTLQQSSSNGQEQVEHTSVPEQAQVAHSHISAIHGQRISLSQPVASAVIATPIAPAGVGGSSAAGTSNAAYQHYLIPGVSLGGQLQNIAIPAQVTVSVQQGGVSSGGTEAVTNPNPTYTISSPQSLARILAAATQSYTVRTGSQSAVGSVNVSTGQPQVQQSENSAAVAVSVPNLLSKVGTGCTVITLPVATATMAQRAVIGGGRQEAVALRLAPSLTSTQGQQQTLILESSTAAVQPGDVTRVHSYSLASASSTLTPSGGSVPQVGCISTNRVMVPLTQAQKSSPVTGHSCQTNLPQKRTANTSSISSVTSVNSGFGTTVANIASSVNNLTSLSTSGTAVISTGSPSLTTCIGSSIPSSFSSPKPKRVKLEEKPPANEELASKRKRICDHLFREFRLNKERYHQQIIELFFLQNGGNMMDYWPWRKRPSPQLIAFLRANALDSDDEEEQKTQIPSLLSSGSVYSSPDQGSNLNNEQLPQHRKSPVSNSSSSHSQLLTSRLHTPSPISGPPKTTGLSPVSLQIASSPGPNVPKTIKQPQIISPQKLASRHHSISAVYDSTIGSQEEIVERAKQEAYVMQRIAELRKEGLWSLKRLPKVQEPPRTKAHWDYLLEEMVWLATDFAQERKWKKAAAKKCARMVMKYHQEKEMKAEKAEKEEQQKLRKIASQVAKEIKQFWANIEKLVEYKQQTWLEEKRKKALDLHLNFIVDQTEKYSSWLTQGMNRSYLESTGTSAASSPVRGSRQTSPERSHSNLSQDEEFKPEKSESDDEETIEKEEADGVNEYEQNEEIKLLQEESEVPLEDLLKSLPPEILEKPASPLLSEGSEEETKNHLYAETEAKKTEEVVTDKTADTLDDGFVDDDDEFEVTDDDDDDEATILEQEKRERDADYEEELRDLQAENELPIEELYQKYAEAYASDFEIPESDDSISEVEAKLSPANEKGSSCDEKEEEEEVGCENDSYDALDQVDVGMEYLISPHKENYQEEISENEDNKNPSKEITDIAATAESFQPKGNTLSTTQVYTKIPFLLKHQLREYQHIGLDWLFAMHDKKLNGILADEMGLGKTIQTIALLAHLACDKGIWGPHLIVVPTSVMLNWEMEFKKWCPAFKILTYYGTPKERKQKRTGWTKPNAFHVCITSYKLVVQDHQSFRRKKWKYFILDEAQHIKNFKSQRWQMLLNFQSSHRLLLTGTPLQNSLMELWSLMHFLMPNVFQSHREFREWFVNPVTGMIEGSHEYNENLIKRLHKVLRPFLLRRLKCEVEKQLPKKYEHVIMCRLSKRQRYLYDDFMSQTKTKETLASGSFMSVINILMQLRKVCNHPNMFEGRPTVSPFMMEGLTFHTASVVWNILDYDPFKHVSLWALNLLLADLELCLTAFAAHRIKKFQTPPCYIEEIDSQPEPPPRCPSGKIRLHIRTSTPAPGSGRSSPIASHPRTPSPAPAVRMSTSPVVTRLPSTASGIVSPQRYMVMPGHHSAPSSRATSPVAAVGHQVIGPTQSTEYTLQLLQQPSGGLPVAQLAPLGSQVVTSAPITVQIQQTVQGGARLSMPLGIGRLVQTSTGQHLLLTPTVSTVSTEPQQVVSAAAASTLAYTCITNTVASVPPIVVPGPAVGTATVLPQMQKIGSPTPVMSPIVAALNRPQIATPVPSALTTQVSTNKPIGRVAPLNIHTQTNSSVSATPIQNAVQGVKTPVVHSLAKSFTKAESHTNSVTSEKRNSLFFMESLALKREKERKDSLHLLGLINVQRCAACPIYGRDLIEAVTVIDNVKPSSKSPRWGRGYVNCLNAPYIEKRPRSHWLYTKALSNIVTTPENCIQKLSNVINRFVFVIPAVAAPCIQLHVSHPPPSKKNAERQRIEKFTTNLSPRCALLHPIISTMRTQFPELRLIQYDCGKLQTLDKLLWQLKSGHHRVLIFTQMTRMLDILEQFLNYHGHTYLRLDGNTRVDQRQALMERFNADKRIFCFILSTRSGGIGVNLTGADTVIFYDSDWNPTMDAQAQDRCHRIGQTRDVHIYRLISERTIEENILKKANQKRILGDLAIEGGNFTTAFFKKNTIRELFGIDMQEENWFKMDADAKKIKEELDEKQTELLEKFSHAQLEQALGMAEEELDLQAAKTARAEAAAELAEFDESIPLDSDSRDNEEKSPAEEELEKLMEQLTPVEKYAMQFLESLQEPFSLEQLKLAEEEIEAQKKDWELGRLKALKEEEERRSGLLNSEEDPLLTYGRADAYNQVYLSVIGREEMPIWAPPTPPQDENDLYIDYSMGFLYEQSLMPESQLPPIYIKKEAKRLKVDPVVSAVATTRKQKVRKDETVHIPRSLFDRPTAAILKMRREAKLQKVKGLMVGSPVVSKPLGGLGPLKQTPVVVNKPTVDTHQDSPEWLVHEDWSVLQVIQTLQDLPLSLTVLSPAHIPNWDLVSDTVNSVSRIYRSPKQCKNRYESVVVPREEGKILYDTNPKKQKKTKGIYKTKNNRPMRTSQLYLQDNNSSFTGLYSNRFETIKAVANKRTPTLKPWFVSQTGKNPKHAAVLAESGISYEQPLTPVQVAVNRAERITREKQKNQAVAAAAAAAQAAEQQLAAQRQQQQVQQQATVPVAGTSGLIQHQAQAVIASLSQAQQLQQATQLSKGALQAGAVTTVSLAKPLGSGIMVNTAAGSTAGTFATISKALGQTGVATVSAQGSVQNATVAALNSATLRSQRPTVTASGTATTMTVQEMVAAAAAAGQVRGLTTASVTGSTSAAPAVVSVSGLTAVQLQAASQRISASSLAAATTVASGVSGTQAGTQVTTTRNMTQSQIQAFRQTALLRQQRLQEQQLKQQQQLKRLQVAAAAQQQASQQAVSGKVAVSVSSPLSASVAAVAAAAAAQQRAAQQQAAAKQSVGRGITEAEVAQLLKRQQQLQQQKQAAVAAAQLTTAQILAQAQLQQVQQQQAAITGTVQTPVATLVKTVSAPTSLGGSPSVAIPVSAVTMAGVNINVSLPQGKTGSAPSKGTAAATVTQQQLRQLQLQHQLLQQQRKVQKVASLAQLAKVQGKSPTATTLPNQLSTVQIVQHGTQAGNQQQGKSLQTAAAAMTVQQIQQVIKQVLPQHIPVQVSSTQSTGGAPVTTSVSQNQLLSHHAVLQAASSVSGIKPAASVALAHTSPATITSTTSSTQTLASAISSNCSSLPVQTRVIPVSQTVTASVASTLATSQPTHKQTIQVVTATPSLTASLQSQQTLRGESGMVTGTIKPQTTTLPSTTLTTSAVLKGTPAVVVSGQPQTAAILQQVASSTAGLTPQQAVTLAVRAAAQAQGQPQVQIQVQQTPTSLVASQSQVVSAVQSTQAQIQQISTSPATATINLAQSLPIQSVAQTASVLAQPSGVAGLTSQVAVDSSQPSPTQVVMQSVTSSSPQPGATIALPSGVTPASTATAQVVQAAIQAAKQQQAAQQQQRASPYTMRLRNPPKQ